MRGQGLAEEQRTEHSEDRETEATHTAPRVHPPALRARQASVVTGDNSRGVGWKDAGNELAWETESLEI